MDSPERSSEQLEVRQRTIGLFGFLHAIAELRSKTVRSVDSYEHVVWFSEIPREQGCYCVAWHLGQEKQPEDVWVEVKKPRLKAAPQPPDSLRPWLKPEDISNSSLDFPTLNDHIIVPIKTSDNTGNEELTYEYLKDFPEVSKLWERYIEEKWWPWAEEDRKLRAVQRAYTDLFSIYQKQQRLGEQYEVVVGLGLLKWKTPHSQEANRHIVVGQTSLSFDTDRGVISLGPAGEGPRPTFELDMLEVQDRPDPDELKALENQLNECGDELWDPTHIHSILRGWVHAASPRGEFVDTLDRPNEVKDDPRIYFAPAVILRKRTERSLLRVYKDILKEIESGEDIPLGIRRVVKILDDQSSGTDRTNENRPEDRRCEPQDVLLPLPANKEQKRIAETLASRHGVLVQGPPGTGKSHTIANLICHLLAAGKKVLVTSHTARALKVLKDKIPPEISALCVTLLGDDREALLALEESVQVITGRHNTWDPAKNGSEILKLEDELDQARRKQAELLGKLRAIREKETYKHTPPFGSYQGTAKAIASRLRQEEAEFGWLKGIPNENKEPPLSNNEAVELLGLLREFCNKNSLCPKPAVSVQQLPAPDDFDTLVHEERTVRTKFESSASARAHPEYPVLEQERADFLTSLCEKLEGFLGFFDNAHRHPEEWTQTAVTEALQGKERHWQELLNITSDHLAAVKERARWADEVQISGIENRDREEIKSDAIDLLKYLKEGGRLGWWHFRPQVVKKAPYLIRDVRVKGKLCDNVQTLSELIVWLKINGRLDILRKHWDQYADASHPTTVGQVARFEELRKSLEVVFQLRAKTTELQKLIQQQSPRLAQPLWHNAEDIRGFLAAARAAVHAERLRRASQPIKEIEDKLNRVITTDGPHRKVEETLEAVHVREPEKYRQAFQALSNLERLHLLIERIDFAVPNLSMRIADEMNDENIDKRLAHFQSAWEWGRADLWFAMFSSPKTEESLKRELNHTKEQISDLILGLAEVRAWGHCFRKMTECERQHLVGWTKAMQRIGKGTGKYASMHRKTAREHLDQCRSAIPSWIMPIYRVAETIQPSKGLFDVVIVDEASQSGSEALFLLYIANKIIVVGDDKQISPEDIGLNREDVELLRRKHIPELPHRDAIGPDSSLFALAEIMFGGRIRLREHFRCMPEIIQFSNDLCYHSEPLIPLKQYGHGRLAPIYVRPVEDGYVKGQGEYIVNLPEAEAVANQIVECCQKPDYEGKSMGVICLQGFSQAREIERMLLHRLGPEEMENRQLVILS